MSGIRRLSDVALDGAGAGASAGSVPVYNSATGKFAPGQAKYNSAGSDYNITESAFRYFRKALAKQRNNEGIASIAWVGDSTTAGYSLATTPHRTHSVVGKGIQLLAGKFGSGAVIDGIVTPASYDYQAEGLSMSAGIGVTLGTGWVAYGGQAWANGLWYANVGAAGTLDFAPPAGINWDTAIIGFYTRVGFTADCWIDSGTHTTVTKSAVNGYFRQVITTATPGAHTVHVGNVAAGQVRVAWFAVYDSTQNPNGIMVTSYGFAGADSGLVAADATNNEGWPAALGMAKPDLVICNLGINDPYHSNTVATYTTNMTNLITSTRAQGGDVLLIVPQASDGGTFPDHSAYDAVLYTLADTYNVGLFDLTKRWGSYATYNANGYGTYPHPLERSYWDEAQGVVDVLTRIA